MNWKTILYEIQACGLSQTQVADVVRKYIERLNAYRASYWAGNRTGQFPSIKQTDQEAA